MKKIISFAVVLIFALVLSACGGASDSSSDSTASKAVASSADNAIEVKLLASNWEFDQETYTISKDQPVSFLLENQAGYHEVAIRDLGISLKPGVAQQFTITEAGTYTIECSVACGSGHSSMKSTLVVQ